MTWVYHSKVSLKHLAEGGSTALETGVGQADAIKAMALEVSLHGQSADDLSEMSTILLCFITKDLGATCCSR